MRPGTHWTLHRSARSAALAALAALALVGCSTLSYYAHLAHGEASLLARRTPIPQVIASNTTPPRLRQRLQLALRARRFASAHLHLPRNRSYTTYADIQRPFVMYNVFATPALSLKPVLHCFPFAGCVAYKGFYSLERAQSQARALKRRGDDVYIGGVPAYSTLGHFADPVLSTMNRWSDDQLVGTIFHELAHQKLYLKGDTAFDESFATFVQREGLREWHRAEHLQAGDPTAKRRQRQFTTLVLATRTRLETLYGSNLPNAEKRRRKQAIFDHMRLQYARLLDTWHGHRDYWSWMETPLNNAKLLPFGLYDHWVPAFAALFAQSGDNWKAFYATVRGLSKQPANQRAACLNALSTARRAAQGAAATEPPACGTRS